ncbi:MAG: 50S ribosomal protein L9 [SAR324 cluster bacterium]|nr:50S ribosomal protein L9 [SAR324 cluster bacterium]
MAIRIILAEDVPNLGVIGDIVQVKPGYARNFLLPQKKAILADSQESREFKHHLQHLEKKRKAAVMDAQDKVARLKSLNIEVLKKAGPGGRLFGSVTIPELIQVFAQNGFTLERRSIILQQPIKTIGNHTIDVRLHTEVKTAVIVKVKADGEIPVASAPVSEAPVEEPVDDYYDDEADE